MRLLKDRRVGTKIMFAITIVALISAIDGLFALNSLGVTNQQVKTGYQHSQELNTVGILRAAAAEGSADIAGTIAGVAEAAQHVTNGAAETEQTATELARTAADLQTTVATYRI